MKSTNLAIAAIIFTTPFLAYADPIASEDLYPEPQGVFCTIANDNFNLTWSTIDDSVKKYAYELNCDIVVDDNNETLKLASFEITSEALKASQCDATCSKVIPEGVIDLTISQLIDSGQIDLGGYAAEAVKKSCSLKVKGLNPPGKSQNHPQGSASCETVSSLSCPAWTQEELASIGTGSRQTDRITLRDNTYRQNPYRIQDYEQRVTKNSEGTAAVYNLTRWAQVQDDGGQLSAVWYHYYLDRAISNSPITNLYREVSNLSQEEYNACTLELLDTRVPTGCPDGQYYETAHPYGPGCYDY
ncbi:hypothetical protein [Thiomicrorhabdus xiamenensis]|uniref:Uncharacterized protein n=1 Tax=Thiomicrorhabdus xiamenensis TaxID=2739063 RepID=A0A7D4SIL5_9GAMM|nr:hypothetical protein [Thiomicrorhabdus xiamenensis]QKI88819.1 hypothetical protein HQN79_04180 [Thiomicrorhabdus xiamenensis]